MNKANQTSLLRITAIAVAGTVGALAAHHARATMSISTAGSSLGVTSVPPPGNSGYVFYSTDGNSGPGANIYTGTSASAPTGYLSITTSGDAFYGATSYAQLNIGGTAYYTGVAYVAYQSGGDGVTSLLATITFGPGAPNALKLGLLEDNASTVYNNEATATVQDAANSSISASAALAGNNPISNDFYFFDLSGLSAGDTVNVLVKSIGSNQVLGGFTFDAVPEPATLGLMAMGLPGILLLGRKRRAIRRTM
jgi:hypothetical protein